VKYKVLTLTPPWGTLIAIGAKQIETRSRSTSYRGPLLIHQGSNLKPVGGEQGLEELCEKGPFYAALERAGYRCGARIRTNQLPRGAIVAVCELIDCVQVLYEWPRNQVVSSRSRHILSDQERAFGDYAVGRFAWLLADIRALEAPIAARGLPGLWTWEGELGL